MTRLASPAPTTSPAITQRRASRRLAVALLAPTALVACSASEEPPAARYASEFVAVEVPAGTPAPTQIAVQACAGLENRRLGGSVLVKFDASDEIWLTELGLTPRATRSPEAFVAECQRHFPRCVRYSYAQQQPLLPSVLSAAAALSAVPLDVDGSFSCERVAFDALAELQGADLPGPAAQLVADRFLEGATGLAMLNPGYELQAPDLAHPAITRDMPPATVDLVFSRRLFSTFLVNGCVAGNAENDVLDGIVNSGVFDTPLPVYGYNNSWLIGGYLYEAQTTCLDSHNLGAVPTETNNLSFFSTRRAPITRAAALPSIPPESVAYDPAKIYVAFVVGDGDNVAYMMSSRRDWLAQRKAGCSSSPGSCAPLTWSISPHLPSLAPDVLRWYFESSLGTGRDYFILPPSGHLYSYPTSLAPQEQDRFVAATEQDARLYGSHTVVHWDRNGTWQDALATMLPKYAHSGGAIRGIVPVNVPYLYDAFPDWSSTERHRIIEGSDGTPLVVFRPRQWRGVQDDADLFRLSPQAMANELASYPAGSVSAIYMTSDGGLTLENSFMALVPLLPASVQLVSSDAAAALAISASGR